MGAVPPDQLGVASGMVATMRSLGVVTGVALLSSIYSAGTAEYGPDTFVITAFQRAFLFAALLCLVAVGLALIRGQDNSA